MTGHPKFTASNNQSRHPKGWGYEVWIENRPEYCGKVLVFNAGKKCSLHYHVDKTETMFLESGSLTIRYITRDGIEHLQKLEPGDSFLIENGLTHQIIAHEASRLFEFSTTHDDLDSYRIEKGD